MAGTLVERITQWKKTVKIAFFQIYYQHLIRALDVLAEGRYFGKMETQILKALSHQPTPPCRNARTVENLWRSLRHSVNVGGNKLFL